MDTAKVKSNIKELCMSDGWRSLMNLLGEGYKGMYVIMKIVRDCPAPVVAGTLAKTMRVSTARIAYAVKNLENKGYVKRTSEQSDARKVVIELTDKGISALEEQEKKVTSMIEPLLMRATEEELDAMFGTLKKILI